MENKILFCIDLYKKKKTVKSKISFKGSFLRMNSRNSVIFDYPGRRLSLSILSLSLFDRNNFSNERAIYDRGEIVMGNQKETCVRARSKTHDGKYEISRRILITTFGYFDIHKGALVSIRNVRGRRYYPERGRGEEKKKENRYAIKR